MMEEKVDKEQLSDLEETIHINIDQMMLACTKKFADKVETKKAVRLLERNMKNMYELFMHKEEEGDNVDDAMMTKKPLKNFTCMSCEKRLVNAEGIQQADFYPWGKLPFRDPSERLARVGHGFSKMLSMIQPTDGQ